MGRYDDDSACSVGYRSALRIATGAGATRFYHAFKFTQARVRMQAPKFWGLLGNTSLIRIISSHKQASRIADKTVPCYNIHGFRNRKHLKLMFYTISGQPVAENTFLVSQNSWWTWSQGTLQVAELLLQQWTWSQRTRQVAEVLLQQSEEGMVRHGRPLLGANPVLPPPTNGLVSIIEKLRHQFDQHTELQL